MCGISGYYGPKKETEKLEIMTNAVLHRGPDDFGYYYDEHVGFGFRRLSIIDLSTGHQPLSNKDESVWVILNGEIYNYKELREELKSKKYEFKTSSDTEVIAHGYEEWGSSVFEKIDGMFAIAVWDKNNKKLLLARDRFGKKPLYYSIKNNTLWFCSELKSLIKAKVTKKDIDLESLSLYFTNDYIPTPKTIFKDVSKLEPATFLTFQNEKIEKKKFWKPSLENLEDKDEKEILDTLRQKIDNAVKKRLVSDVPLGLFLSGGLDSTIIAESASRLSPRIKAFTLGFTEDSYDETENAKKVGNILGLEHHIEKLSEEKAKEMLDESVNLLDEPLADPSILPQLLVSKFTKNHVTVALSGDGGDELLLGYQHIPAHIFVEKIKFLNKKVLRLISKILNNMPVGSGYFSLGFKLQRFSRGLAISNIFERDLAFRGSFQKDELKNLLNKEVYEKINKNKGVEILENYATEYGDSKSWSAWSFAYLRSYLMDDVLVKVDRATMWYGLEARAPLLDTELVNYIINLPDKYKLGQYKNKGLFKELLKNKIPEEILNSPKHGFGVPVSKWLNTILKDKLVEVTEENFIKKQNLFNRDFILKMIDEHKTGKIDRRKELWSYLIFQLWYINWIENND